MSAPAWPVVQLCSSVELKDAISLVVSDAICVFARPETCDADRAPTPVDPMPCTCVVVRLATFIAWKADGADVANASSCVPVKP